LLINFENRDRGAETDSGLQYGYKISSNTTLKSQGTLCLVPASAQKHFKLSIYTHSTSSLAQAYIKLSKRYNLCRALIEPFIEQSHKLEIEKRVEKVIGELKFPSLYLTTFFSFENQHTVVTNATPPPTPHAHTKNILMYI